MRKGEKNAVLCASYTVEAAGVMAAVLFTILLLISQAFRLRSETVEAFLLHEAVERERHAVAQIDEPRIRKQSMGKNGDLDITASVFRPENSLRMWSLAEDGS